MAKFLCICLSSTIQKTVNFKNILLGNVNRSLSYRMDASGKAVNSARVLNQLENSCAKVICPLGEKNKDLFLNLAEIDNLKISFVTTPGFTRECLTLLNSFDSSTTELVVGEPDCDFEVREKEVQILDLLRENLKDADGILFAGSRPSYWSEGIIPYMAKMITDSKKIFLADYHGKDLTKTLDICVPSIIKINLEEFLSTFGFPSYLSDENLKEAVIQKSRELKNIIIVTRGSFSTYAADCGEFAEFPTERVKTVNTTACGDSFSAGFLYEYVNSKNFYNALSKGTWCASRNAEREIPGTVI